MNIFEVLHRGKSRLHEPSMSSMLGYLLDPFENHGMGDSFLRQFLVASGLGDRISLWDKITGNSPIQVIVSLEEAYTFNNQNNHIDILLILYADETREVELLRVIIENKIQAGAAQAMQLCNYYQAVRIHEDVDPATQIAVIFLTPKQEVKGLIEEYNTLTPSLIGKDIQAWMYWSSEDEKGSSVLEIIQDILNKELRAEITPINEYLRHTIKAFAAYIVFAIQISNPERKMRSVSIGGIVKEILVEVDGHNYELIRRTSGQIEIYDTVLEEKIAAKPILRKIIKEQNLDVELIGEGMNRPYNTRQLGRRVIAALENQ